MKKETLQENHNAEENMMMEFITIWAKVESGDILME